MRSCIVTTMIAMLSEQFMVQSQWVDVLIV